MIEKSLIVDHFENRYTENINVLEIPKVAELLNSVKCHKNFETRKRLSTIFKRNFYGSEAIHVLLHVTISS